MGRKKKKKKKAKQKQKPKPQQIQHRTHQTKTQNAAASNLYRKWSYVWGVLGPLVTIFSLYLAFYPSVSIAPNSQADVQDLLSVPFSVLNNNIYSIKNIDVECGIETIGFVQPSGKKTILKNFNLKEIPNIANISPRGIATRFLPIAKTFNIPYESIEGTITMTVNYKPLLIYPQNQTFKQKYRAYMTKGEKAYWIPISE